MRALLLLAAFAAGVVSAAEPKAAATTAVPAPAAEPKLRELNLTYRVKWNGIGLGDVAVTLKPEGGPDCYRYESRSDPVGIVKMFYGKPREVSNFCVKNGRVVPKRFQFFHDDDDSFALDFDMSAHKVRDDKGNEREIPDNAVDRFGMHQAVRLWVLSRIKAKDPGAESLEIAQVDDDSVRKYTMAITGPESVRIPAGQFDTILVQRVDNPKNVAKFWVAPDLDYMPVKVVTMRPRANLEMELRK
jgi:hypothetical protein